jgi:prepilin peptidase CpaA
MVIGWAVFAGFLKELFKGTGDLVFGWNSGSRATISDPMRRKMPYAPAIAIGTLMSFFAR